MKKITKIVINTLPRNTGKEIEPVVEILDGKNYELIWTNNHDYDQKDVKNKGKLANTFVIRKYKVDSDKRMIIDISSS